MIFFTALASVIAHSLAEDEFGVVQKDLKTTLAELTRLSIAIDAYVRASGVNFFLKKRLIFQTFFSRERPSKVLSRTFAFWTNVWRKICGQSAQRLVRSWRKKLKKYIFSRQF